MVDLNTESNTPSETSRASNATKNSTAAGVDSKMATETVSIKGSSASNTAINTKTGSHETASFDVEKEIAISHASKMNRKSAPVDTGMAAMQAPVDSMTTPCLPTQSKVDSSMTAAEQGVTATTNSDSNSNMKVIIEVRDSPREAIFDSSVTTEATTKTAAEYKSDFDMSPSTDLKRVDTQSAIDVKETKTVEVKVSPDSSPAIINDTAVKTVNTIPNNTNNLQKSTTPVLVLKTRPDTHLTSTNKENLKPFPPAKTAVAVQSKTSPTMNSAIPNNRDLERKRLSALQAKCRVRGIDPSGSPTRLVQLLLQSDQREREFQHECEKQQREFQRKKVEEKVKSERGSAHPSSRTISQASSRPSDGRLSDSKPHSVPPTSQINTVPRQQGFLSTKFRSPTILNTTPPSSRPVVSQDTRLQQDGKTDATRNFKPPTSHDIRLQPDIVVAKTKVVTTGPSNPQTIGSVLMPANNGAFKTAEVFSSEDLRAHQGGKPVNRESMKPIKSNAAQDIRARPAAKQMNINMVKTSREADKVDYLHKHTWEIKDECQLKGLPKMGDRKTAVTRLLDNHLTSLRAEFKHARDELALDPYADPEGLLKKDILWYRLECFHVHRLNQIGLASEPTRAASYIAARECKYESPRFAKIMGDILAGLIDQEKQLGEEKAKWKLDPTPVMKEGTKVKLEPSW